MIWDPDRTFTLLAEHLFFKHRISPYLAMRLAGKVRRTFLRGVEIYDGQGHPAGPIGELLLGRDQRLGRV